MAKSKIELGIEVRDIVTNFTGTVTGHAKYLTGCDQFLVTAKSVKNKTSETCWFDENRLERQGKDKIIIPPTADKKKGGPSRGPSHGGLKNV